MADEIASIDINTAGALKAVDALIAQLRVLDKEIKDGTDAGKDMTAQQKQLDAATASLNKTLTQETQTLKGTSAQATAATRAKKELANTDAQLSSSMRKSGESASSNARLLSRSAGAANALKGSFLGAGKQVLGVAAAFGPAGIAVSLFSVAADYAIGALTEYFTKLDDTAKFKEEFAQATQGAVQSIVSETRASNGLFAELRDGNTTQERRRDIVKQLNEQYPETIGSTNLLTASETELARIQAKVNAGIRQRILAQAQEAQTAEIVAKIAQNQVLISQETNEVKSQGTLATRGEIEAIKARDAAELDRLRKTGTSEEELARIRSAFQQSYEKGEIRVVDATSARTTELFNENERLKKQLKTLDAAYKETDRVLSDIDFGAANTAELAKNTDKATSSAKAAKVEQQALAGTLAALRAEQSRLNKALQEQTRLDNKTEVAKLGAELKNVNAQIKDGEELIRKASEGDEVRINSISELRKAAQKLRDVIETQVDREDIAKLQAYNTELKSIEAQIKLIEQTLAPTDNVNTFFTDQINAAKIGLAQLAQQTNSALSDVNEAERAALSGFSGTLEEREAIVKKYADQREQIETDATRRRVETQIQIERLTLQSLEESGTATELQIQEQIAAISELELKLTELGGKTFKAPKVKGIKEAVLEVAGYVEQVSNAVFNVLEAGNARAVSSAEKAVAAQQSVLDKLLSQEEGASARQIDLEKERLEKLNDEREKAKNREAIIVQAQIAINLALAVARAAVEGGGIASAITISAAIAAAVVGFVAAKQAAAQAYNKGTLNVQTLGSPSSDNFPARPRGASPKDTIPAWLSPKEAVLPEDVNTAYHPTVAAIFTKAIPANEINEWVADRLASPNAGARKAISRGATMGGGTVNVVNVNNEGIADAIVSAIEKMPQTKVTERGIIHISQDGAKRQSDAKQRAKGWG